MTESDPLVRDILNAFTIVDCDLKRPWGRFYCIDSAEIERFIDRFFPRYQRLKTSPAPLSPKILVVNAGQKLSWQYHNRRKEVWLVVQGPVGVVRSADDQERPISIEETGAIVELERTERHRLVGLLSAGVVAEIWIHTDSNHPSDEDDIVRLQDSYGR